MIKILCGTCLNPVEILEQKPCKIICKCGCLLLSIKKTGQMIIGDGVHATIGNKFAHKNNL